MRKFLFLRIAILFVFFIKCLVVKAQDNLFIPYLEQMPVIDGLPDTNLCDLSWKDFSYVEDTQNNLKKVDCHYKIAYNTSFLYLLIEAESDTIVSRDRAYQNGDGFHLVVAKPDSSGSTGEFYVLKFSPGIENLNIRSTVSTWYYNIALENKRLSNSTLFECKSEGGKSYFELLLCWGDVYPYHPSFNSIGFNLCFVKAHDNNEKSYHYVLHDEKIQSELSRRMYVRADFENINSVMKNITLVSPSSGNIFCGKQMEANVIEYSARACAKNYLFSLYSADDYDFGYKYVRVNLKPGINKFNVVLPTDNLASGGYRLKWKTENNQGDMPLSVLPDINFEDERVKLKKKLELISNGDYNTMMFLLQNIENKVTELKTYESAGSIRESITRFSVLSDSLNNNKNYLKEFKGVSRRAFRSAIDNSLQPYSLKLPAGYDEAKKYPLLVILHGSGSDDQNVLNRDVAAGNFIELAPFGRGTSNCFSADGATVDIKEAIDDVKANFSVDTTKIIISGFSMGGYGAYRIFYEYPNIFCGVAVFSGHPSLGNLWLEGCHPDFTDMKYLKPFKKVPVFIYHSKNDLNCPYSETKKTIGLLKKLGVDLTLVELENAGHIFVEKENKDVFSEWLNRICK